MTGQPRNRTDEPRPFRETPAEDPDCPASRQAPGDSHISLRELQNLGWSNRMTWQLLGPPDLSLTPEPFPKRPNQQLYQRERTQNLSWPDDRHFLNMRLSNLLYDIIRFWSQLDDALRWAHCIPVQTDFPAIAWDELVQMGLDHRKTIHGDWAPAREQKDPRSLEVLAAYVYLKHERTNYDQICQLIRGRPFARFTYPVLLNKINRLILDAFPECLSRTKGINREIQFTCRKCGKTAGGRYNGHYFDKPERWLQRTSREGNSLRTFCSRRCSMPGTRA